MRPTTPGILAVAIAITGAGLVPAGARAEPGKPVTGPGAAVLAYIVSQNSPLLSRREKIAISQDFNGAPLDGPAKIRVVTAASVSCRARNPSFGRAPPVCLLDFGGDRPVELKGQDRYRLFKALGKVGAEDDAGMGHVERRVLDVKCTVDDAKAQGIPSTGDDVAGFSCSLQLDN